MPFPNTVAIIYITGAELLEQLEAAAQGLPLTAETYALTASFMHVSGIEYTIDTTRAFNPGEPFRDRIWYTAQSVERVSITSINGAAFDPSAIYAVITSNANFNGMDISYILAERASDTQFHSTITTARVTDDAVMGFIASLPNATIGAQHAALQGRITVTGATQTQQPQQQQQDPVARMVIGEFGVTTPETTYTVDAAPFVDDNRVVLVPIRAISEALGASVDWAQEASRTDIITMDGDTFSFYLHDKLIINGRAFATTQYISDNLGVIVQIDGEDIRFYRP